MEVYYLDDKNNNLGDNLNKVVLEWLGIPVNYIAERNRKGKFVGIGSIMSSVRSGDTVWGTGMIRKDQRLDRIGDAKFLAVRGRKTRKLLKDAGYTVPEIYGDPSMLLPLIYNPQWDFGQNTIEIGYIPHYADKDTPEIQKLRESGATIIDIQTLNWKSFVRQILQCKKIVSSSLHGIIIAEAYGRKVEWAKYSDNIIGGEFKFRDYLTGTKRREQTYGELPPLKKETLKKIQDDLIKSIKGR